MAVRARTRRHLSTFLLIAGSLVVVGALALLVRNVWEDYQSGRQEAAVAQELERQIASGTHGLPEGEMPVAEVDGLSYVGLLDVPSLGLSLPVQASWSAESARISPGRWGGSAYDDDLVIAGEAYKSQFGDIGRLQPDDEVGFTDIYGNRLKYRVIDQYTPSANAVVDTSQGDGDLLLCTYAADGQFGVYVSCERDLA